jgi:hypothetical protein
MLEGVCDGGRIYYEEPAWVIPGTVGAAVALLQACAPIGEDAPQWLVPPAPARTGRPDPGVT